MRKLLITLIIVVFAITLVGCKKEGKDQFVVGLECAYAPFNYTITTETETSYKIDGTNSYCDGYDVKMAKLIADELGKELVIKALDFDGLITALTSDNIDAIIAGMSPRADRKESIDFTDNYFRSEQVVVVRKDSVYANANSINDFVGAKITAQQTTLQEDLTPQLIGATKATSLPNYASLVTAVTSGTVDGFIAELPVATHAVSTNKSLTIVKFTAENGFVVTEEQVATAIGLRKSDTDLKTKINAILAKISEEQRNQWMNEFVNK